MLIGTLLSRVELPEANGAAQDVRTFRSLF